MTSWLIFCAWLLLLLCPLPVSASRPRLVRVAHGDPARIVQFADLHLSGGAGDEDALALMRAVLGKEKPDLVVFTGDQVAGGACPSIERRLQLWERALAPAAELRLPFATVFGNHDDLPYRLHRLRQRRLAFCVLMGAFAAYAALFGLAGLRRTVVYCAALVASLALSLLLASLGGSPDDELGLFVSVSGGSSQRTTVRRLLAGYERQIFPTLSCTGVGPERLHGVSNYRVELRTWASSTPLYFLDSGGGLLEEAICTEQLDWLREEAADGPGLAFMHLPPVVVARETEPDGSLRECAPPSRSRTVSSSERCGPGGFGQLLAALDSVRVGALFVGHDHSRSGCCRMPGPSLRLVCHGAQSGITNGRGSVRGARIIDVRNGTVEATRIVRWDAV